MRALITALAPWAALLYCLAPAWAQAPSQAPGAIPWSEANCARFAHFAASVADFRDAGAKVDLHLKILRARQQAAPPQIRRVLERELARVYAEAKPAEEAEVDAYTRCMAMQLGGEEG